MWKSSPNNRVEKWTKQFKLTKSRKRSLKKNRIKKQDKVSALKPPNARRKKHTQQRVINMQTLNTKETSALPPLTSF